MGIKKRASQEIQFFKKSFKTQSATLLFSVPILLTLYRYYGSEEFFNTNLVHLFHGSSYQPLYSVLYSFFLSFFFLLIIPVLIMKVILKKEFGEFGGRWGDKKAGFLIITVLFPIIAVIFLLPASRLPDFLAEYPLFRQAGKRLSILILYELSYGFYYLSWEFFFRGYMLFGLKDTLGATNSILIQTIPSTLMHIGKPDGEILASILAGLVFGAIALRTRSVIYVFILHWLIGITLDVFILLSAG